VITVVRRDKESVSRPRHHPPRGGLVAGGEPVPLVIGLADQGKGAASFGEPVVEAGFEEKVEDAALADENEVGSKHIECGREGAAAVAIGAGSIAASGRAGHVAG